MYKQYIALVVSNYVHFMQNTTSEFNAHNTTVEKTKYLDVRTLQNDELVTLG